MVESQEQIATQRLVANLREQDLLGSLLERSKPPRLAATDGLDYLLATPFRYPPRRHGSRFGRGHEPSLFYAARGRQTLRADAAYYRLVFWQGMKSPPSGSLRTQHTLFGVRIHAWRAYGLHRPPFGTHRTRGVLGVHTLPLEQFSVDGVLPMPAA